MEMNREEKKKKFKKLKTREDINKYRELKKKLEHGGKLQSQRRKKNRETRERGRKE